MSLVLANINVNFTAVYVGNHRVCYRIGNSGSYTCVTVNCAGGGTACSVAIPIMVDNETCVDIQFNGYVQPSCIDIASDVDRLAFSVTFVPTPSCKTYVVTCNSASVAAPTMTNVGSGYNPASPPNVLFTGGGGTGVVGVANVGTGFITSTTGNITNAGTGYTNGTYTNVDITGGTGTGAKATVIVSGGVVTSITITAVGNGYLSSDTLGLDYTDMAMGSPPAVSSQFTITSDYGTVKSITITTSGSGYTTAPDITIGISGGVRATATGNLNGCTEIDSTGCDGVPAIIPANIIQVGQSVSICHIGNTPVVDAAYSINQTGNCLCVGVIATIGISGTVGQQVRYIYNRKNGGVISGLLTVGGSPSVIIDCIVSGSLVFKSLSSAVGTVSYGGAC